MEYNYKDVQELMRVLREYAPTTTEINIHAFIMLCHKHNICPCCGEKASKFSSKNYHCDKCRSKFSVFKSKHKYSTLTAYAKLWISGATNKFTFNQTFRRIIKTETKNLYILGSLNAIELNIKNIEEFAETTGKDYPQEEVDLLLQKISQIYTSLGIQLQKKLSTKPEKKK